MLSLVIQAGFEGGDFAEKISELADARISTFVVNFGIKIIDLLTLHLRIMQYRCKSELCFERYYSTFVFLIQDRNPIFICWIR